MLKPEDGLPIPEQTKEVAKAAFPKGNLYMRMREEIGSVFEDEEFADLYPEKGQPTENPWRLALITIFQYVEGMTDRQTAEAVRGRIDWKYALGLELTDAGFDFSVLSEFRQRLVEGGKEQLLFERLLKQYQERGFLKGKKTQRTDSTHVIALIRRMNRLELVGETMRRVLNDLAQQEAEWLKRHVPPEWIERYGRRFDLYRLPKGEKEQSELAEMIGWDGLQLLHAIYATGTPESVSQMPSIEMLRRIWLQQFYWVDDETRVHWRTKKESGVPPAHQMIASPDEADARYAGKGSTYWTGYKVHLTETCQPGQPHLITHVETTPATTHDSYVTEKVQDDLAACDLAPEEHLVDSGYVDTEIIFRSLEKGIQVIGPVQEDHSWQARANHGFDQLQFQVDWDRMQATCPNGKTSSTMKNGHTRSGEITYRFSFAAEICAACTLRASCTKAKTNGREICVFPPAKLQLLIEARQRQNTEAFKKIYQLRSGIEGTMSQAVNRFGQRAARYRGFAKTHLQSLVTAAAINFVRLADWLCGDRPETTRISPLASFSLQS